MFLHVLAKRTPGVATVGGALKTAAFRGDRWCLQRLMDGSNADELLAAAFAAAAAGQAFKGGTWESHGCAGVFDCWGSLEGGGTGMEVLVKRT